MAILEIQNSVGEPINEFGINITPFSKTVKTHPPGSSGGFIWNRPVAILAQYKSGEEVILPVQDLRYASCM